MPADPTPNTGQNIQQLINNVESATINQIPKILIQLDLNEDLIKSITIDELKNLLDALKKLL